MLTTIGMAREVKNFFGVTESRYETLGWGIERKHVLKAINHIVGCGNLDVAHFDHADGTHDAVWQESWQRGTDRLTLCHWSTANSKDETEVTVAELKRMSRTWTEW